MDVQRVGGHIAHIVHIAWSWGRVDVQRVGGHIAHIAHIARTRGRVDVQRVGTPYAPHFAWFLHGFCMWNSLRVFLHDTNSCTVFTVFACGTACTFFLHDTNSLHGFARFLHDTNSLHGFARFLHVEQLARFCTVFACGTACMTRTACTVLHGFRMTCGSTPCPSPVFFLSGRT